MPPPAGHRVVHLELHTDNLPRACAFYTRLFGWSAGMIDAGTGSYLSLGWGAGLGGGVVERETEHPLWLPYVQVGDVDEASERAQELGAAVRLEPRDGPAGRRSVLSVPAGGEIALWQSKR